MANEVKKYRAKSNISTKKIGVIRKDTVIDSGTFSKLPKWVQKNFKPVEVVASVNVE